MCEVAFGNSERNFRAGFFNRSTRRDIDTPFEFSNIVRVIVQPRAVAGAEVFLERGELMCDGIEYAGTSLSAFQSLVCVRTVAEQAFKSDARIDFGRKRRRRIDPGNGVGICAAVTPIAIPEVCRVFDTQLDGRQDRVVAIFFRDELIDRYAQIRTDGITPRPRTR